MPESRGSLLLIEDEESLVRTLGDRLRAERFDVTVARTVAEAWSKWQSGKWDIVVLDVMLPDGDGFDLMARVRASGIDTPTIFLTARGEVENRVSGLRLGADDYLSKPFKAPELMARLEAVLRRSRRETLPGQATMNFGPFTLNLNAAVLDGPGGLIHLSNHEFDLLAYLARNRNRVINRTELLKQVWNYHDGSQSRTVDQHVAQLRKKLDAEDAQRWIVTIHGRGYMLRPD